MAKICRQCTMSQVLAEGFVCPNPEAKFCGSGVQPNKVVRDLIDYCMDNPVTEEEEMESE